MNTERYMFRGKRIDNGEWVTGYYVNSAGRSLIFPFGAKNIFDRFKVDPATIEPVAVKITKRLCSEGDADAAHTYFYYINCPNCRFYLYDTSGDYSEKYLNCEYCPDCGQRLDWEVGESNE